ncbi:unnamed protein product [Phyllotreta striolata]|uniref:Protein Asterix n=1 Tax=Phyllotreta striolata TaxID=444603 RepID=A0A9N9TX45_PHYSR|nr:unnamed protein product [Phyllotreta striolata]
MNVDPRRPEKIQKYVPKSGNGAGNEDLTPDYMNILGQQQTAGNMTEATEKHGESTAMLEPNLQVQPILEDVQQLGGDAPSAPNATNVIPTSAQYGVAIISTNELASDTVTPPTGTVTDTTAKPADDKEFHSTPSRNDRFKVVKIASLEPFKRGRWKCMDYVDEAPPVGAARVPQSSGSIQISAGAYMQTQSLPQQQIQQMLLQSGFANGAQFVPQLVPQNQYFYPPNQPVQAQFIGNQTYFPAGVVQNMPNFSMPQGYQNIQYVPANLNLIQNHQSGAFVSAAQPLPNNFQQSQSYAGQPNVSQTNVQPTMNGHNFTVNEPVAGETGKSVTLNSNNTVQVQQNVPMQQNNPNVPQQQYQQQQPALVQPVVSSQIAPAQSQTFDQNLANNVYTNPQFAMSVNSLTVLDNSENATDLGETNSGNPSENIDDLSKTNPVVNAIDNKIEQAMDLVKSHLMYTVREEVEVLKEKIAELMEKIQQLETENNFLRSQIPKGQSLPAPAGQQTANFSNALPNTGSNASTANNQLANAPASTVETVNSK